MRVRVPPLRDLKLELACLAATLGVQAIQQAGEQRARDCDERPALEGGYGCEGILAGGQPGGHLIAERDPRRGDQGVGDHDAAGREPQAHLHVEMAPFTLGFAEPGAR